MFAGNLDRRLVESHGAIARGARAPSAPNPNRLLAALPRAEYERLRPHLDIALMPRGWVVHGPGVRQEHLYFVADGVVSRYHTTRDGARAEACVVGREGVVGIASFLGGKSDTSGAVVLAAGHAYRLRADRLEAEMNRGGLLRQLLLRYTQELIAEAGQLAACNRHHSVEQQLSRWILTILDRSPSNGLAMTHESMATMLGVRREAITQAAGRLQRAGLVRYSRGHIAVLDPQGLEARACECYGAIRHAYEQGGSQ
ncbi:MAG: Crp/Fnr family transcriptional regulator [Usitatibacter sp.]